jgi:hypothetical protein
LKSSILKEKQIPKKGIFKLKLKYMEIGAEYKDLCPNKKTRIVSGFSSD